jgi:hypothetical protein
MTNEQGSIAGHVVDKMGGAVAGVSVAISASTQPHSDIAALTNADGYFRFSGLLPGQYTLTAFGTGNVSGTAEVVVSAGQESAVEVRLDG